MMRRMAPAVWACALGGCYPAALRVEDPPPGDSGLRLTLRGQDCESQGTYSDGRGSRALALAVRIENPASEPIAFDPRKAELRDPGGPIPPIAPIEPIRVDPGRSADVVLRYLHSRECTEDFQVAFEGAFRVGAREARIGDLRLRPY